MFVFNERSGRVERLHHQLNDGTANNQVLDSIITADAQNAHDSSWLRRPRSKIGSRSRAHTPTLSRHNSISMEEITSQDQYNMTPLSTPVRSRPVTGRAHGRGLLQKAVSIDNLQYEDLALPPSLPQSLIKRDTYQQDSRSMGYR